MKRLAFVIIVLLIGISFIYSPSAEAVSSVDITGELKKWHTVTLTLTGPSVSENASGTFLDHNFTVKFTGPSNQKYTVPGYFAADGRAAHTSATNGNKWRVHFRPDEVGTWTYNTDFIIGANRAVQNTTNGSNDNEYTGLTNTFTVEESDKPETDFRNKGRLEYVDEHYLQFSDSKEFFVKGGTGSPENFLAYAEIDGATNFNGLTKNWNPHKSDWQNGDPTWKTDRGKGIIGAINYLSDKGVNSLSFSTFNHLGPDGNVFPHITPDQVTKLDVSKLDQWGIIFEHAQNKGLHLHFKTQENSNQSYLNNGNLFDNRKLYYRELVARFGHHLAVTWDLGTDNDFWTTLGDTNNARLKTYANYFNELDPYDHLIVVQSKAGQDDEVYGKLTGSQSKLTGASLHTDRSKAHSQTIKWIQNSAQENKKWVVTHDKLDPLNYGVPPDGVTQPYGQRDIRNHVLWGNLFAGGAGVEYYFGTSHDESNVDLENFRSRDQMWEYTSIALDFFQDYLPFHQMKNGDDLTVDPDDHVFYKAGQVYAIYTPTQSVTNNIDLASGTYDVRWYDPKLGGELQIGTVETVTGGNQRNFGQPPHSTTQDWVAVIYTELGNQTLECAEDINLDGVMDDLDYDLLVADYFKSSNFTTPRADINQDNIVDLSDYSLLVKRFGETCSSPTG